MSQDSGSRGRPVVNALHSRARDQDSVSSDSAALLDESTLASESASGPLAVDDAAVDDSRSMLAVRVEVDEQATGKAADRDMGARIGRYILECELGRGGMGVVYRAHDPEFGRDVALKIVLAGSGANTSQKRRFLREARAVARLEHPNIVQVHDMGEHESVVFYTMQYIDGSSLTERIARGPLAPREAARLCADIAHALAYAHRAGLVHRDVKPGNILLDGDTPKLTDFGLVKQLDGQLDDRDATAALTRGSQVPGTPAYMAPEQLAGKSDDVGPAADQYALGIVLFAMVSGERPFSDSGSDELLRRLTPHEPPRLPVSGVPTDLDLIRRRTMAYEIDERYPDCAALAADLERFLRGEPVLAASPGLVRRTRWLWRRYWRRLTIAAVVALAVVGGIQLRDTWSRWQLDRARVQREEAAEDQRLAMEARVDSLLAERDNDAADALFAAFVEFEDNQGTRAFSRGWLHHGQRLCEQGRSEACLDALATAYATAEERAIQREALIGVAQEFRAQYLWRQLDVVLATLRARVPRSVNDPRVRALSRDAAIAHRDFASAAAMATGGASTDPLLQQTPLLSALAQATPTEHHAEWVEPWDIDRDGRAELALFKDELQHIDVVSADEPALRTRTSLDLSDHLRSVTSVSALPDTPTSSALITSDLECLLVALTGTPSAAAGAGFQIQSRWPCSRGRRNRASGDLDSDGRQEHYVSVGPRLFQLENRGAGDWHQVDVHAATNAANSQISRVIVSDLDSDGMPELIAGSLEWASYDIRVFRAADAGLAASEPVSGERDRLKLVYRNKLGAVGGLSIFDTPSERLLAVLLPHDPEIPLNYRMFAPDRPHGEAQGIHLFALSGDHAEERLIPRGFIPIPLIGTLRTNKSRRKNWPLAPRVRFQTGDIDGDGQDELVLGVYFMWTFIYRRDSDGRFSEQAIADVEFLTLAQLDSDSAMEMIVNLPDRDKQVWVLGAGDERVPVLPTPDRPLAEARGPTVVHAVRDRWQRAEDLNALGLARTAADQLRDIAALAVGTIDEGRALYRAAEILAAEGALAQAGLLFQRAARRPDIAASSLEAAMRTYLADHRWQSALQVADERMALADPPAHVRATAQTLRERLAVEPLAFDFHGNLNPSWQVLTPIQIRRDREGRGLRVSTAGMEPHMRLPLDRTREPLRVTIDFELERMDWASCVRFDLAADDGLLHDLKLCYNGGGNVYNLRVDCPGRDGRPIEVPDIAPLMHRTLRLTWEHSDDGPSRCELSTGGVDDIRVVYSAKNPVAASGPFMLAVDMSSHANIPATSTVLLHRIELTGFAVAATEPLPLARAHYALAMGRPDEALPALEDAIARDPQVRTDLHWLLARAVAAEELGDRATTESMLAAALGADADMNGYASALFRHHLDRFEDPLRAILGHRYYSLFWTYVNETLHAHRPEGRMLELLTRHLGGLDTLPVDSTDVVARIAMQVWRGRAWRYADRTMYAIRDLEGALRLGDKLLASHAHHRSDADAQLVSEIYSIMADAGRELASCYLVRGEPERAIDALLGALTRAPAPAIFADMISASPEFTPLRTHPRWREIERIQTTF